MARAERPSLPAELMKETRQRECCSGARERLPECLPRGVLPSGLSFLLKRPIARH